MELLRAALVEDGWQTSEPDNWRDSGWAITAQLRSATVTLVISAYGENAWILLVAPAEQRTPGILGLFKRKLEQATSAEVLRAARVVHRAFEGSAWCTEQRWALDGPPDQEPTTPGPEDPREAKLPQEGGVMTNRVECTECGAKILQTTFDRHGGLCAQCARISPEERARTRAFRQSVETGEYFRPTADELASARAASEIPTPPSAWALEPDFHIKDKGSSIQAVLADAAQLEQGDVFLLASDGARLSLSFGPRFGVVEYQNAADELYLYAYSPENVSEQVPAGEHVDQACPCCGVGMLWYPSRFHMPRRLAFEALDRLVAGAELPADCRWLAYDDDISHVSEGCG